MTTSAPATILKRTQHKLGVMRTLARDLYKAALLMEDDGPGIDSARWDALLRRCREQFPNETPATRAKVKRK